MTRPSSTHVVAPIPLHLRTTDASPGDRAIARLLECLGEQRQLTLWLQDELAQLSARGLTRDGPGDFFSVQTVARRLDVSDDYVRRLIDQGELTETRLGRLRLIHAESYAAFVARLKREGA